MSVLGGLTTATRAFGELFGSAHTALGNIQKSMASALPSMPGLPVGKFFDLAIGIDFHPTVFPPWPICPVPHVGMVFDLMACLMGAVSSALPTPGEGSNALLSIGVSLVKGMAPSVKVHGQWIAQAGIEIVHLPGLVFHLLPLVAAQSESEMWMGSSIVLADGGPCSTQFHPALSCNIFGVPSIFRKGKPKLKIALKAPTSLLSIITSTGKPVLVGGPPTIDLFQLALKGLMAGLKGLTKKIKSKKLKSKKSKLCDVQAEPKRKCVSEPVDIATGRTYHTNTDFELNGPIPVVWNRTYYSDITMDGPLGYNWHHSYNIGIRYLKEEYAFLFRHADGRESMLPQLMEGQSYFDRFEKLFWSCDQEGYVLCDSSGLLYRFNEKENVYGYRMVSQISTKDGFQIQFLYSYEGCLEMIIDSKGRRLKVENDSQGRVVSVFVWEGRTSRKLVSYCYDKAGDMVETKDTLGVAKKFWYEDHLIVQLTNQSGMSFYWEYKGKGDHAKCIHAWGDGGIMEYFLEYASGITKTRNGENAETTYYYDSEHLIYKIVDANGGITRQSYNEFEELEMVVNPEGFSTKRKYDDHGNVVQRIDENGESLFLSYDENDNLVRVLTPGGKVFEWDYDEFDRTVRRKLPSGDLLTYTYDGKLLKYITDKQKRRFELEYDERYELERLTYPNGICRRWRYDEFGRVVEAVDVMRNVTRYQYDAMDRITQLTEPDGNIHHFRYDDSGNLIHAEDKLREVEFTYGALGTLTSRKQGNRKVSFGYNTELQLINIRNEKREIYDFDLDGLGQVVAEYGFDGLKRRYVRDGVGRVVHVSRPSERWTDYVYDGVGNVIKETQYDGKETLYDYDNDHLLLKAYNDVCKVDFKRDKAGRIVEDKQNGHIVTRQFDEDGNCIHTMSNLGADIQSVHDEYGYLQAMISGDTWNATWKRDEVGLEVQRTINSGLEIHTWRDGLGRETKKTVSNGSGITQGSYSYQWGINNRLLAKSNDVTGLITTFEYNEFDELDSAMYRQGSEVETIYRVPDRIGALYKQWNRRDREYDYGGKLLEDPEYFYHYDAEGNLIFKEYRSLQPGISVPIDKKKLAKELGIGFKGSGTGWRYDWYSNGMLKLVIRPDGRDVFFDYDALGRRLYKVYNGVLTRWVWDGNTPIHECTSKFKDVVDITPADNDNLTTWIFEDGTFMPVAKITKNEQYSIVTDYMGTPIQMYNQNAKKTWDCELDIYGKVRTFGGSSLSDCPFRMQGMYADNELDGLYYNRFRWYDSNAGNYISQDPIRLLGTNPTLYGYVKNITIQIDLLGLNIIDAILTLSDGSEFKWNDIKADKGAKSIPGRTGDAEQKLLRDIEAKFNRDQLKGAELDIKSKGTWVYNPKAQKAIPIDGIAPCDFCDAKMAEFAKNNEMDINYNYKNKTINYH